MNLTNEQQQALDSGDPIPLVVNGRRCVVITRELYDQFQDLLDDPKLTTPLINRMMAEDDKTARETA